MRYIGGVAFFRIFLHMVKPMLSKHINWEKVSSSLANLSKRWWGAGIGLQVLVVLINIAMVLDSNFVQVLFFLVALLSIFYVLTQWQSDRLRRISDSVKRKYELLDGLGWRITPKEISDLIASVPEKIIESAKASTGDNYFESSNPPSSTRLLQNLEESSWWTKHLAESMMKITAVICASIFALATITLLLGLQAVPNQLLAIVFAKIAVSIIVFVFSGGYFRMSFEFFRLSKEAEKIEDQVVRLLIDKDATEITALKTLHEYQIVRSGAPQIPTWIWSFRQRQLNQAWKLRRELERS
jgi:hypothetical protein